MAWNGSPSTPTSAAARLAAVPELMEMVLLSLPLHEPRRMKDVFSWTCASRALQLHVASSIPLRYRLFLLDERQACTTAVRCPSRLAASGSLCPHDIPLRPNPLLSSVLPGYIDLTLDYDDHVCHKTGGVCRRWHFALELHASAYRQWKSSAMRQSSWRATLLTQPACRRAAFTWYCSASIDENEDWDSRRRCLRNPFGISMGEVCDTACAIVEKIGHEDFAIYLDKDEAEEAI